MITAARHTLLPLVASWGLGHATSAQAYSPSFQTPSGNIVCYLDNHASVLDLVCIAFENDWARVLTADECDADQVGVVVLGKRQAAYSDTWCISDVFWPYPAPVLGYGSTWAVERFDCRVDTDGVRCSDTEGSGAFHVRRGSVQVD